MGPHLHKKFEGWFRGFLSQFLPKITSNMCLWTWRWEQYDPAQAMPDVSEEYVCLLCSDSIVSEKAFLSLFLAYLCQSK